MKTAIHKNQEVLDYSAWPHICHEMKKEYGDAIYNSWLKHLLFVSANNSEVVLSAPTRFIREWILNNYADKIKSFWQKETPSMKLISIIVRKEQVEKIECTENSIIAGGVDVTGQNIDVLDFVHDKEEVGSPLDRRLSFENFVVGNSNNLAFAAAKSIAENTNIVPGNNPLFIYGGVGLGKTHLMHSIALHIKKHQPKRRVVYLSAEKFMYKFIHALRNNSIMAFKENFRHVDVLMIDDIQFICGKESTQEEFFHTVNSLLDMNKQIIISGDRSPTDMEGMKERVRSRLGGGLVADITSTDFELRLGILKSKAQQIKNTNIPEKVLNFLAEKVRSNTRELEGAMNKVVAHATLIGKEINLQTTQEILSDLLRANEKTITISDIQKKVADYFGMKVTDMASARRARCIARPRQIAMYLCKQLTVRSLSEIGRKFGGKDHTTVMHAVKKVEELSVTDIEFKQDIMTLMNLINQ